MTHNRKHLAEMVTEPDLTIKQIVQQSCTLWLMTGWQESKRFYAYSDKCLAPQQVRLQMRYSNAINNKQPTQKPSEKMN